LSALKVYPEILFRAIHHNKPVGAFRLWFIAKDFDSGGCGFIPAKAFRQYLRALGIPKQTLYRWLGQAGTLGLITRQDKVYRLTSWQNGARAAFTKSQRLCRAVLIPKERFLSKGWLAWCWAGFILHHTGIISRAALEALSGVPARTQLAYEKKAGVVNKANYASYLRPENDPEMAIGLIDLPGHYGKAGEIRRRLPNSREVSEVSLANKGRLKQINRALFHIEDSSSSGFSGEIDDPQKIYKLYSQNWRATKKVLRALRKRDGDVRCRPAFIYEHERDLHGVGVFFAISL